MRQMKHFITSCILVMAATGLVHAGEIGVVLVGDDVAVRNLSKNELANIFLGKKTNWEDGTRINIGYMNNDSEKMETFFEEFVGQSHRRFKKYWVKKVFAGYGIAPRLFKDVEKALEFINRYKGGIAFVTVSDERKLEGLQSISIAGISRF